VTTTVDPPGTSPLPGAGTAPDRDARPATAAPPPGGGPVELARCGERIEQLLDQLASLPDRRAREWAEELLRLVTDLYGAGLARVVALGCRPGAPSGAELFDAMAGDELLSSLLVLHDLHPLGASERLERALGALQGSIGSADVRLLGVDERARTARVRLLADGWVGSPEALERLVRAKLLEAAPEIDEIEIDRPAPAVPVSLRRRPAPG
jgi:hypothetical protein